jgi:hypothetical protein
MPSKTPESGIPQGSSHIKDISEVPVVPFGGNSETAKMQNSGPETFKVNFKRADDIVYAEESHLKRNIMAAAVVLLLAVGIFFVFYTKGHGSQAQLQGNTVVKKMVQFAPPSNSAAQRNSNVSVNVSAPTLFYNETQLISNSYVNLFGTIGWDRPSVPSQHVTQMGPPKWIVGPFSQNGYISISYFTNPTYSVWFTSFSAVGTAQTTPAQYRENMLLHVVAGQTYELDLIANPPVPYNVSMNNTVTVHVQVYYIPASG